MAVSPSNSSILSDEDKRREFAQLIDQFEEAWQNGIRPEIRKYVDSCRQLRSEALVELIHIDLERRIKIGESARIEQYLSAFPELENTPAEMLQLIIAEIRHRHRLNKSVNLNEIFARFPGLQEDIRNRLAQDSELSCVISPDENKTTHASQQTSTLPDSSESILPGYINLGTLGHGGMGVVYKARHVKLNRIVALKMIISGGLATPEQRRRFQQEAEAVAKLVHPNIVQIYEIGTNLGLPYIALEFVPGTSLFEYLAGNPQDQRWAAEIVETLARAMEVAHQHQIIHRDLKPANILITAQGVPKITDFGLAKHLDSDSTNTRTGTVIGSPSYMSPEQAFGRSSEVGPSTDIYALGAILYEMLTGRPPFRGEDTAETLNQVRYVEPVPPRDLRPRLPRDLDTICLRCLQKSVSSRFESAEALADDLRAFLDGRPIASRPITVLGRMLRWTKRNPITAGLSSAIVLITLVGFLLVTKQLLLRIEAQRKWVNSQVDALLVASEESIPFFVTSLNDFKEQSSERLLSLYRDGELTNSERIRVGIALLEAKPALADDVARLVLDGTPGEIRAASEEFLRLDLMPASLGAQVAIPASTGKESEKDRHAFRVANAAITLARLGKTIEVWPLFRSGEDNSIRSYLINRWGDCGVSPHVLVNRINSRNITPDERRAIILTLASYPMVELSDQERADIISNTKMRELFMREADKGVHAAACLLLCRWGHTSEVAEAEQKLFNNKKADYEWYVTTDEHTMSVFAPATFQMGSPDSEEQRDAGERLHEVRIERKFSIAQHEVTVAQFERFQKLRPIGGPDTLEPDRPARAIRWSDAAAYCNWLTNQAGIASDQLCYVQTNELPGQLRPAPNYLQLHGFRLPTEAEWEYACRAGSTTPRYFGHAISLLPRYAWCLMKDSSGRKGPVASLLPNDAGIFDAYGNATEWCNDSYIPHSESISVDEGGPDWTFQNPIRVLRGLAAGDVAIPRSALRDRGLYTVTSPAVGFRIARTEPD